LLDFVTSSNPFSSINFNFFIIGDSDRAFVINSSIILFGFLIESLSSLNFDFLIEGDSLPLIELAFNDSLAKSIFLDLLAEIKKNI
jgi:hypothetical protein